MTWLTLFTTKQRQESLARQKGMAGVKGKKAKKRTNSLI